MKKLMIVCLIIALLMPMVFAEQESLGIFKRGQCVDLLQTCASCSYVMFTSVRDPDGINIIENINATRNGSVFTAQTCSTYKVGTYMINGVGDVDGTDTVFAYSMEINQTSLKNENIYLFLVNVLGIIIIMVGFYMQDYAITMFGSILMLALGVYYLIWQGGTLFLAMGAINIMIGGYILIAGSIEQMNK